MLTKLFAPLHHVVSEFHPISICDASLQPSQGLAKVPQKKNLRSVKCNTERKTTGKATVSSPAFLFYWLVCFSSGLLWSKAVARHPAVSLLTGRAGSCLFPYSVAGANRGTGMFC